MKKTIFLMILLLSLSGCVHHKTGKTVMPSAVPEKRVTKTAIAPTEPVRNISYIGSDPWEECAGLAESEPIVQTVSELEPEEFRRRVQITFMIQNDDAGSASSVRRCMNGKVYACLLSDSPDCVNKLDLSTEPNDAMKLICADPSLEGGILAPVVTGQSAYEWACQDGEPVLIGIRKVADAAGYDKSVWFEIPDPNANQE